MTYEAIDNLEPALRVDHFAGLDASQLQSLTSEARFELERWRGTRFKGMETTTHLQTHGHIHVFDQRLKSLELGEAPPPAPKTAPKPPAIYPEGHANYTEPEPLREELQPLPADEELQPLAPPPAAPLEPLEPVLAQTDEFFRLLGKERDASSFRSFKHKDHPGKPSDKEKKKVEGWDLRELNRVQRKLDRSIYAVINNGGQEAKDITSSPAFFCEWDGATRQQQLAKLLEPGVLGTDVM